MGSFYWLVIFRVDQHAILHFFSDSSSLIGYFLKNLNFTRWCKLQNCRQHFPYPVGSVQHFQILSLVVLLKFPRNYTCSLTIRTHSPVSRLTLYQVGQTLAPVSLIYPFILETHFIRGWVVMCRLYKKNYNLINFSTCQ